MAGRPRRLIAIVPNLLSLGRLCLAAVFPFLGASAPGWRAGVVAAGGLSDWLDGLIARRFDARTRTGTLLDGIADKVFVLSVLLTLTITGLLAWWEAALVVSRELAVAVVAGYVAWRRDWAAFGRLVPRLPGKIATALQFALFLVLLLWGRSPAAVVLLAAAAFFSLTAAVDYLALFARALADEQKASRRPRT